MNFKLYELFGPIISDFESDSFYNTLIDEIDKGNNVKLDFEGVVAMSTKSAKKIFGSLYSILNPEEFYNRVLIFNASNTIKEIIYDSILNSLKNINIKKS